MNGEIKGKKRELEERKMKASFQNIAAANIVTTYPRVYYETF